MGVKDAAKVSKDEKYGNYLVIESKHDDGLWIVRNTTLKVRRVWKGEQDEHVQIEVLIERYNRKTDRLISTSQSVTLLPDAAEQLISALRGE